MAQAEARAHRIGQVGEVRVQYLIAQGTADDIIWPMLQNKQGVLKKIGLCNDDYGDANTKEVLNKVHFFKYLFIFNPLFLYINYYIIEIFYSLLRNKRRALKVIFLLLKEKILKWKLLQQKKLRLKKMLNR